MCPCPCLTAVLSLSACVAITGGHTKAASYRSFLDNAKNLGAAAAAQIARLELANINAVHAFARAHAVDCDSHPCTTVDVIYDDAHWREAHEAVDAMRGALGADDPAAQYTFHDPDKDEEEELATRFHCGGGGVAAGTDDAAPVGGVSYAAGSISGYKLGVGVLRLALQKGLNLQTNTPATRLTRLMRSHGGSDDDGHSSCWEVITPRGRIVADRVVLATNGYTAHLWPAFQGAIVPLRGQVTAHRPGSNMPKEGLPGTYSFIYEDGYEYMIPRPVGSKHAGDIVIGGGLAHAPLGGLCEYGTTDDSSLNETISEYLYGSTARYFGKKWGDDHPDGRIRKEWTGIMGYSPDGFPFVGEVPGQEGLWVSCSFQGHGMVLCWMCAKALVTMMQGQEDGLDEWFPRAFRVTEERMRREFTGRLHTSASGPEAVCRERT